MIESQGLRKGLYLSFIGVFTSLLFLYLSFRGLEVRRIFSILQAIDEGLLPLCFLFVFFGNLLASYKWSIIEGNSTLRQTFPSLLVGLFVNNVLPVRIGEMARAYVLSRKTGVPITYSLSTVLLDRFFDLAGLLLLALVFFPEKALPKEVVALFHALFVVLVLSCILFFIAGSEGMVRKVDNSLKRRKPGAVVTVLQRLRDIQTNVARLNSPRLMLLLVLLAALQWSSMTVALLFAALALGIHVSPFHLPFVCSVLNLGLIVPSSPGYVGVYEFLLVTLLSIFGIPKHEALSLSVLFHAVWYVLYTTVGFVFFLKEGVSIGEIKGL